MMRRGFILVVVVIIALFFLMFQFRFFMHGD